MRTNSVKTKLRAGEVSLGTFVFEFNSTGIARLAALSKAEFILFDMEHSGWTTETIRTLLATVPESIVPMVRVPATEYDFIARAMDMGAMGIMVPMVESADQARQIVQFAKYPPSGRRGAAFGMAHDQYRGVDLPGSIASANDQQIVIAQIETVAGIEQLDEIAAVDGIDVLWVGQTDLTSSLGIPGQFENPTFLDTLKKVAATAARHQKAAGYMSSSVPETLDRLADGFSLIAYGGDILHYRRGLTEGLEQIRQQWVAGS